MATKHDHGEGDLATEHKMVNRNWQQKTTHWPLIKYWSAKPIKGNHPKKETTLLYMLLCLVHNRLHTLSSVQGGNVYCAAGKIFHSSHCSMHFTKYFPERLAFYFFSAAWKCGSTHLSMTQLFNPLATCYSVQINLLTFRANQGIDGLALSTSDGAVSLMFSPLPVLKIWNHLTKLPLQWQQNRRILWPATECYWSDTEEGHSSCCTRGLECCSYIRSKKCFRVFSLSRPFAGQPYHL